MNEKSSGCGRVERHAAGGQRNARLEHATAAVDELDGHRAAALAQRGLQRIDQSARCAARPSTTRSSTTAEPLRRRPARQRGGPPPVGEVDDAVADLDAREAALDERGRDSAAVRLAGRRRAAGRLTSARAPGVLAQQRRRRPRPAESRRASAAARGAVDAADLRVQQAQVVVHLGGGAHRGARRAHGVLLLERHGGPDVLDAVHVGPVEPVEEHARVGRERLDVAPLALGEQGVEGERGFARAGDAGDDGEPVVGNVERDVLQVVLAGSLDPEPRGLGHSTDVLLRWKVYPSGH